MGQQRQAQSEQLLTLLSQAVDALAQGGGDLPQQAKSMREMLTRAPRVAVVGRLKSGKSTLVNALTQHRIAATGSLECTMVVSHYLDGAPARAEVLDLDGQVRRIPLGDGPLTELGRPVDEVDHVRQYLPNARLRELSLIDTPGTATLTVENEARTRRMLIDGQQDTRRASSWADSIVFLADSAPREDERTFLSQLGMTPLTMIGVLSRADSFGEGAFGQRDPIAHAQEHSGRILRDLGGAVSTVLPLSGLLAESALTGRVTNEVARSLAQLAELDREQIIEFIEVEDPATVLPGFSVAARDRLIDILGEYGIVFGRRVAAEGGAVGLLNWLTQVSGVERLTATLTGEIKFFAELQRAVRVLDLLEDLAGSHPEREHVRWVRSVTLSQPAMHFVLLYRSYRDTYRSTPDSRLLPQLHLAIVATSPAGVVATPAHTPAVEVRAELESRLGELQQLAMTPLSAAEDEARERLIGAYQQALRALAGD
ncbi:dynamin family protein [Corynebacterium sp. A21]|uniref:dynamin family protein n=1 Tax=Corynebacterium sp. A21 TaxID=3457318 RepID=UPI003FD421E9